MTVVGLSLDEIPSLLLFDGSEVCSGADTVEVAVLAMVDHSRFIPMPSPDKINESKILSLSGDNGIKVPTTIDSISGDDSATCSGLVHRCNRAKFPLPKYTTCRSTFFNMSSCKCKSAEFFRLLHNIPLLRCTKTSFSTSKHKPNNREYITFASIMDAI